MDTKSEPNGHVLKIDGENAWIENQDGNVIFSTNGPDACSPDRLRGIFSLLRKGALESEVEEILEREKRWKDGWRPRKLDTFRTGYLASALEMGKLLECPGYSVSLGLTGAYEFRPYQERISHTYDLQSTLETMIELAPLEQWIAKF